MRKHRRKVTVLEHLGSVHTEADMTALLAAGEEKLSDYGAAEQLELELGLPTDAGAPPRARAVVGSRSSVLSDAISQAWKRLGLGDVMNDNAFFHLVLARIVEPTSSLCKSGVNKVVWPEWDVNTGNNSAEEAIENV